MAHPVRHLARAFFLATALTLSACAPATTPQRSTPPLVSPTLTLAPPATRAPATSEPATPPAEPAPSATPAPPAPIFGPAWGDRDVYRSSLIQSERATLDQLAGASEYRIALAIDPSMTRIEGEQQVRYTNREETALDDIYLRLFPNALGGKMEVSDVTVNGAAVETEIKFEGTALRVPLPQPLLPGESAVIGLRYEITVPETLDVGYGLISYTDGVLALDTPYAPIPVYDDEGWNVETPPENADTSFNDASLYLARVTAPANVALVATGTEIARAQGPAANTVTYALGPARDFFVAASADYTKATRQVGETRVNSYALAGDETRRDAALDAAAAALMTYSERLGPYPYTEFDVAATPMLALGIEYPGAVGISTAVYDAGNPERGRALESTVAHEAAHQWFYNLVGSDQIDEPWLDEAVTQYATWLYFVDRYGKDAASAWRDSWGSRWERTERDERPVGLPAREYTPREYGSIVYGRGPLFIEALAERMGQERFDDFLGDYARQFRWDIAAADDFKRMAEEACACQLDDLYARWLDPGQ